MDAEANKAPEAIVAPEKSSTPATTDTFSSPSKAGSSPVRTESQGQSRKVSLTKYDGQQQIKSKAPPRRSRSKYKLPTTESKPPVLDEDSWENPSLEKKAAVSLKTRAKRSNTARSASKKASPPEEKPVPNEDHPSEPEDAKPEDGKPRRSNRLSSSGGVKKPGNTRKC
ncbi:hypothetical protein CKAH01_03929 [Colletotrichum kahawae]|uniref:Uncharacterized protein n=1 Tax=Colletotrichum kahawae TaxID=34407 RepID=A0AAD9YN06_COLKA|nr:hypothetical protein CKAH01_03929 [Colletotrichum kahawae]